MVSAKFVKEDGKIMILDADKIVEESDKIRVVRMFPNTRKTHTYEKEPMREISINGYTVHKSPNLMGE